MRYSLMIFFHKLSICTIEMSNDLILLYVHIDLDRLEEGV
jgi:hypothetical protein